MNLVDRLSPQTSNWNEWRIILLKNTLPDKGLAVARMAAHITYLSKKGLQEKFGRKLTGER